MLISLDYFPKQAIATVVVVVEMEVCFEEICDLFALMQPDFGSWSNLGAVGHNPFVVGFVPDMQLVAVVSYHLIGKNIIFPSYFPFLGSCSSFLLVSEYPALLTCKIQYIDKVFTS